MKITEVRNNLFGLEDLKGLINENTFNERVDWNAFFETHPELLDDKYNFRDRSSFYNRFDDENDTSFRDLLVGMPGGAYGDVVLGGPKRGNKDTRKNRHTDFKDNRSAYILNKKVRSGEQLTPEETAEAERLARIGSGKGPFAGKRNKGVEFDTALDGSTEATMDRPTTLSKKPSTPIEWLKWFFDHNNTYRYSEIINTDENEMESYVNGLSNLADAAFEKYTLQNVNTDAYQVGNEKDPFSLFLLFYYKRYIKKNGLKDMTGAFLNNIDNNNVKEYVSSILYPKEKTKTDLLLEEIETFLSKFNIKVNDTITNTLIKICTEHVTELYSIAINSNVKINIGILDTYNSTACGLVLNTIYILQRNKNFAADDVFEFYKKYMSDKVYDILRGTIEYFRQINLFNQNKQQDTIANTIGAIVKNYGEISIEAIFDPLKIIHKSSVKNAVSNALKSGMSFADFEAIEIPDYINKSNLNKFESFIVFCREFKELLSDNAVKYYGGEDIINEKTLFGDAGIGLNLLKGKITKERYQRIEDFYSTGDKNNPRANSWTFYDLLSEDYFSRDKTQRAIFYFLKANTNADRVNWIYEYNRKTQTDKELNPKSIDILCEYDGKKAAFEYQGEQHFRPQGITPADEVENETAAPNVKFFNELKDKITSDYLKKHDFNHKWEVREIYEPIMRNAYESSFERLVGEKFETVYRREMERMGYLKSLASYKKLMAESKLDRQRDITDIIKYMFVILCRWNGLELPKRFQESMINEEIFKQPKLNTDVVYLGSPWRFKEELHVYFGKISDKDKADLIKKRGWAAIYIVPPAGKISNEDIALTKKLANPSNAVFEWTNENKPAILDFARQLGLPIEESEGKEEEEKEENSLFEEIIREIVRDYNPQ